MFYWQNKQQRSAHTEIIHLSNNLPFVYIYFNEIVYYSLFGNCWLVNHSAVYAVWSLSQLDREDDNLSANDVGLFFFFMF